MEDQRSGTLGTFFRGDHPPSPKHYTELLLEEHQSSIPTRPRWTTGEAEHFQKEPPEVPDQTNPEHYQWIKRPENH